MDFRAREGSFEEAERRYGELVRRREVGEVSDEDFREEQHGIMARDHDGYWWARLGDAGEWYRREGGEWLPGTPPGYGEGQIAGSAGLHNSDSEPEDKHGKLPIWIPVTGLIGVALIALVLIGWALVPHLREQSWFPGGGESAERAEGSGGEQPGERVVTGETDSGAAFAAVFVQQATPENVSANSTYIDNPLTNANPDAVLIITQNWNPGGGGGRYNDHPVGVWYDSGREKWAIFNQDRAEMPDDAAFNVAIREN